MFCSGNTLMNKCVLTKMETYIPAHTCEPDHAGSNWFFNNDVEAVRGLQNDPVSEPSAVKNNQRIIIIYLL